MFDLDGTITRGDTYLAFLLFLLRCHPKRVFRCVGLLIPLGRFAAGRLQNDELKQRFLAALTQNMSRTEVHRAAEAFCAAHLPDALKPTALERIATHRARGDRVLLATASLDLYALAVAERLGITEVACTRAAYAAERLTGLLDGPNLLGEAKLAAVRAMQGTSEQMSALTFYSDHRSDWPTLCAASHPVVIDPSPTFARQAHQHGMCVQDWGGNWSRWRVVVEAFRPMPNRSAAAP